jgi:hypothetical protein
VRARRYSAPELATLRPHELAGGVLLATVRVEGRRLGKGARIDDAMAAALIDAGRRRVLGDVRVAWLDPDDVHEDEAAERLALAVGGAGVDLVPPHQSRLDLVAKWDGVLHVDVPALLALNALDALEVFTLFHGQCVVRGEAVASVKVAPHVVAGDLLRQGVHRARAHGAIVEVRPYLALDVPAIVCEPLDATTRARFEQGAGRKLAALGSRLSAIFETSDPDPERAAGLAEAALERVRDAKVVLVAGVSAGDPLAPFGDALTRAGGQFTRRGLPAHPGSMLWLAGLGSTRLLGLPSCGMFSLATAADLVLPRLLTGERLDAAALADLAHGGVLSRDMRFRMPEYARTLDTGNSEKREERSEKQ